MAMVRQHPEYELFRMKQGYMQEFSGSKKAKQETPNGTMDGTNRSFFIGNKPIKGSDVVHKDGMLMEKDKDYTLNIETRELIFSEDQIPQEKSVILVDYKYY